MKTIIYTQKLLLLCTLVLHDASKTGESTNFFDERKTSWQIIFTPTEKKDTRLMIKHRRTFAGIKNEMHRIVSAHARQKVIQASGDSLPNCLAMLKKFG
ncbi:MAG: hypothetical protein OXC30_02310 [Alphaproteobacteria bacterium]|nr:hypothetical protein [Alphaproteobacteria bacterium]